MEKGVPDNLRPVTEETNEEDDVVDFVGSKREEGHQDEDEHNGGNNDIDTSKGDLNKFDGICDGVLSAMALVHEAMQDFLEFKDEMLMHALPPTVLIRLTLITARVFRSISDLGIPVGELVRLARIYSTSWEENSASLMKLHENYESKQRELNIAIKRLHLIDEQSKQVERERHVLNWEKLFSKVTSVRSRGRRWKFLIKTIKEKAKLGLEHVQAYTQGLEETSESEEEKSHSEEGNGVRGDQDVLKDNESDKEDETQGLDSVTSDETKEDEEVPEFVIQREPEADVGSQLIPEKVQVVESVARLVPIRPPMRDVQTWTQEPQFDRSLFVRVFCPEGLQQSDLKCSLSYSGNIFKTPVLDIPDDDYHEASHDKMSDVVDERIHGRSLPPLKILEKSGPNATHSKPGAARRKRFFEFRVELPDETEDGVAIVEEKSLSEPETLRLAVHTGKFEEIIAFTNIDFKDIQQMSLETIYLPPPHGDDDIPPASSRANSLSMASSLDGDSVGDSVDISIMIDDHTEQLATASAHEDLIKNSEPRLLSLYSLQSGRSDAVRKPCGNLPVLIYWGKCVRPLHFNRQCGTHGGHDTTYIDLASTTKEDLQIEMMDEALSVATFTPRLEEKTVSKSELDAMVEQHEQKIISLHQEYKKQVDELLGNLQTLQTEDPQYLPTTTQQSRPVSMTSQYRTTSGLTRQSHSSDQPLFGNSPNFISAQESSEKFRLGRSKTDISKSPVSQESSTSAHRTFPPRIQTPSKNIKSVGHRLPRWGEHLPQDFFERLHLWEEDRKQHKQELNERTLKDIKDNLEKKLAGQHKLSMHEEHMYDALKDVSLPALFMPYKTGHVYNPRAHHYFHPTGATNVRLTQPPSAFQLPPLPKTKVSVVNLFELSKNFHIQGPAWLLEHYTEHIEQPTDDGFLPTSTLNSTLPQETTSRKASFNQNLDSRRSLFKERDVES